MTFGVDLIPGAGPPYTNRLDLIPGTGLPYTNRPDLILEWPGFNTWWPGFNTWGRLVHRFNPWEAVWCTDLILEAGRCTPI